MRLISTRGWSFDDLLAEGKRFKPAPRVPCTSQNLEKEIQQYEDGLPLVIEGWHQTPRWPKNIFNIDFCRQYFRDGDKTISVRNIHTRFDKTMSFDDFIEKSRAVSTFAAAEETERWYGKDVECPQQWEHWLRSGGVLPHKLIPDGSNDLLTLRPKRDGRLDVETLMCYFGVAGTHTPCHKDLCASSGHNLMCYTEKDGSSFWFMTKGSDCSKVTEYFHTLKYELDHECQALSISELANAPFDVYIVEQKLGDLVLVPPRSCHQVINFGGLTVKMSWSRMTLAGLTTALYHELPLYRRVCRPEIYRVKSTIYYTLRHYTQELKDISAQPFDTIQKSVRAGDLATVLRLYDQILVEEYSPYGRFIASKSSGFHSRDPSPESETQSLQLAEAFHACDFCGADIFQGYFQCTGGSTSKNGEKGFVVCPGCYIEGRTCVCEVMEQMQCQSFDVLFAARWDALQVLKDVGSSVKSFKGSESLREQKKYFTQPSDSSVFHAAMLLYQARVNQRQSLKSCRNGGDSHSVSAAWALSCKKCHAARCFPHLLESCLMHSMRAFLLQERDQTHEMYHKEHAKKFPGYHEGRKEMLLAQEEGMPCAGFNVRMVYNSLKFRICQPVNTAHIKLGWYDQLLPEEKHIMLGQSRSGMGGSQRESGVSDTTRSSSPQAGVKNHAYVEVKRVKHRPVTGSRAIASDQLSSSSLSSISQEDIDTLDLDPQCPDSRKDSPMSVSRNPPVAAKLVKPEANRFPHSTKVHESRRDQSGDGTIFAAVHPIGPPRKRKRQEVISGSKDTSTAEVPKAGEPNGFAAALGAAINQVAETATKTGNSAGARQKSEQPKKRFRDNTVTAVPATSSTTRLRRTGEDHIVVNVAELQDLVTQTAERTVRRMVPETVLPPSLATKVAVSIMTGYAAAGTFVNGNTQIRFPSLKHFAEVSPSVNQNQGISTSSQLDKMPTSSEAKQDDRELQTADRTPRESYSAHPTAQPQGHRQHQKAHLLDKKRPFPLHSGASVSAGKKRRMEDGDEE